MMKPQGNEGQTASNVQVTMSNEGDNNNEVLEYTLYLIRHGEASHNVLEKIAEQQSLQDAIEEGLNEEETKQRMEQAREAVLLDDTLFDAPLSKLGIDQARKASICLQNMYLKHNLRPPDRVLVSPLTRTLETTSHLFPENNNIHVREELRERNTGKPPDFRSPPSALQKRQSFQRFSMTELVQLGESVHLGKSGGVKGTTEKESMEPEDKATLRERTHKLFQLLAQFPPQNIAVVTHKGYLRELERGPFGKPLASEFDNCEIRVYRIQLHGSGYSLNFANRIV
jgi:broad specificity phosphatase PhoE